MTYTPDEPGYDDARHAAGVFMLEHGFRGMTPENAQFQTDLAALLRAFRWARASSPQEGE